MNKKLLIGLSVVLIIAGVGVNRFVSQKEAAKVEDLAQTQQKIDSLNEEKAILEEQLAVLKNKKTDTDKKDEKKETIPPTGFVTCLSYADLNTFDNIYGNIMYDAGFEATLVFNGGNLPGINGSILSGDVRELTDNSWDVAISAGSKVNFSGDDKKVMEAFKTFMSNYIEQIEESTGYKTSTVYFQSNTYKAEYNDTIKDLGFNTVYYEGDYIDNEDDSLTLVHVYPFSDYQDALKVTDPSEAVAVNVFIDGDYATDQEDVYDETAFKSMLDAVDNAVEFNTLKKAHPRTMADYIKKIEKEQEAAVEQISKNDVDLTDADSVQNRIDSIEKEIEELYKK